MKIRGYEINETEISDQIVARHVRTIENSGVAEHCGDYVEAVIGQRIYIAYLT